MAIAPVRKGQLTQFGGALRVPNGTPGRRIEYPYTIWGTLDVTIGYMGTFFLSHFI
jgi:hypothetical protein